MVNDGAQVISGVDLLASGRLGEAREQFRLEAARADADGDAVAFAEAALGLGGLWVHEHRDTVDRTQVMALQRRALDGVRGDSGLATRLRARLAAEEMYITGQPSDLFDLLDAARRDGDPTTVCELLSLAHHCLLGPHHHDRRMSLAEELMTAASSTDRPHHALMGLMWRTVNLFLAGDRRAKRSLRELRQRLRAVRCDALSYVVLAIDVMLNIREGDLVEAERQAEECYRRGTTVGDSDAAGWYGAQLTAIRWAQGRSAEVLALVQDLESCPTVAEGNEAFTAATASLAAQAGDLDAARAALTRLDLGGLARQPSSSVWLATLLGAAEAAHALGDTEVATTLVPLLEPFAHLPVMGSLAVVCFGSAQRPLALAALTQGDLDLGIARLEAALAADLALGHRPSHAISAALLAEALDQRARLGDRARSAELWQEAIDGAERCGLSARADQWRSRARRTPSTRLGLTRHGRTWLIQAEDRSVTVADSVGMGYLSRLVAQPGVRVPAVELATGREASGEHESRHMLLDPQARARYRSRAADLREEIDDADSCADLERAARARLELEALLDELGRAAGLGGRTRAFATTPERARTSVRQALTRALRTIAAEDEELAASIGSRLETGTSCTFHPPEADG